MYTDFIELVEREHGIENVGSYYNGKVTLANGNEVTVSDFENGLKVLIGRHIYRFYTQQKQAQDISNKVFAETAILVLSENNGDLISGDDITVDVGRVVLDIISGKTTKSDFVNSKPANLQQYYEKLVSIGLRLKWKDDCIYEGELAIRENRKPIYPQFKTYE